MLTSIWWKQLMLVMCGGALGAALRFWFSSVLLKMMSQGFPWATLAVNTLGAFCAGILLIVIQERDFLGGYIRAFLVIGLLGGLTTFSTLMVEFFMMIKNQRSYDLLLYSALSLIGGLFCVSLGAYIGNYIRPQ